MIVCPVCEHAQPEGEECEVCGRRLAAGRGTAPLVEPVAGLEPTHHAATAAPAFAAGDLLALEPTAHGAVHLVAEPVPDVEPTLAAPVDVDAAPVPDLERTAAAGIPDDGRTALPAFPTCRYCRTPALGGERVCTRCGMRLPAVTAPSAAGARAEPAVRLCSCGAPLRGPVCPACGGRAG